MRRSESHVLMIVASLVPKVVPTVGGVALVGRASHQVPG